MPLRVVSCLIKLHILIYDFLLQISPYPRLNGNLETDFPPNLSAEFVRYTMNSLDGEFHSYVTLPCDLVETAANMHAK